MTMAQARPDDSLVLRLSRRLPARREVVFRALTEPGQLSRWWGPEGFTVPECTLDPRPGGAWRTVMRSPEGRDHVVSGVYREIMPPARLVLTWAWESDGTRGHETLVTIELQDQGEATLLVLHHEVFESESSRNQHRHGWGSCLDCLERALAAGTIDGWPS
jgi:uncharacterized protein YndB with AHSA1/START domain